MNTQLIQHFVLCVLRVSTLQFFTLDLEGKEKLVPQSRLSLPHCPLDIAFDPEGRLWVLMDSTDAPLKIYTHRRDFWEVECDTFRHMFSLNTHTKKIVEDIDIIKNEIFATFAMKS